MNPASASLPSPLGLGCVTFGREIERDAALAMMDHAHHAGWTMFDTASAYGGGASERILGEWAQLRAPASGRPVLATKILPPYAPDTVLSRLHASLERLQRPCAGVLYLHQWHESALDPAFLAALQSLLDQRLVRSLGVSNFNAEQLSRVLALQDQQRLQRVTYLQNIHNFAVRGFDPALGALCEQAGIQRIGFSPLGAGFLTGKYRNGVPAGTRFALIPGHQAIYFTPLAQARLGRLLAISDQHGLSPIDLALAWATCHPAVSLTLIGGRSVEQLTRAARAPALVPAAVLARLDAPMDDAVP
jgi:aryl-alcohol dehydrogenase-like predicted oxidoreductase